MTGLSLICMFVCIICTVFNAIIIKKFGKLLSSVFEMQDQIKNLSSLATLSNLSGMGIDK